MAKSEVFLGFKNFKAFLENQLTTKIKSIDYWREYISNQFMSFLKENSINHRFSCAHTHKQMEIGERKHRHIFFTTKVLTIFFAVKLINLLAVVKC